ncbi:MAG: cupin domain-containing protein [Paracoccaceae bacterium]|nr:cupin domain-containing protein [Paracoccaceae bacterium]
MSGPVKNVADMEGMPMAPEGGSERFGATVAPFSEAIGLSRLGATFITVEPGKRGFPFHNHLANDEMFVVLEGEGTYRFGDAEHPIKAGDVCGAPRGGADTAHQIVNTGDRPLKYVGISTRQDPEVVEYPDSGKYAALAIWPGEGFWRAHLRVVGRAGESLDYWDGEDL